MRRFLLPLFLVLCHSHSATAEQPDAGTFATPLSRAQLDPAALMEWASGAEKAVSLKGGPSDIIWTRDGRVEWSGAKFGDNNEPGVRHLRVGFTEPVACEAVLVRGGGKLSVLKSSGRYPGSINDSAEWLQAERVEKNFAVGSSELRREEYAIWVLPSGTKTRALRFTHEPVATEKEFAGWLGGAWVLPQRIANIAAQATATTSRNQPRAPLLNGENAEHLGNEWESVSEEGKVEARQRPAIDGEHAEWVMLTWPQAVPVRGLCALWAGFATAEAQVFAGPENVHPREAEPKHWRTVAVNEKVDPQYPLALGPNWFDFGKTITTRAVRLRITAAAAPTHDHVKNKPLEGRNVWLGELMALRPLEGIATLASAVLPRVDAVPRPPIPVRFTLPQAGNVTLVIEDAAGKRVRNLVSDIPFPAGQNIAWWDGLDDLGRDTDAARHGLYHVPGQLVTPGTYRVRGLVNSGFDLKYEFPIYTAGTPAWNTEDKTGAWLSNHAAPESALFVPADRSPLGQPLVYLGSYVSEGTHGLAWVDLEGKKVGGMNWVGGNWTGAPFLACDLGQKPAEGRTVFSGSVWPVDRDKKPIELELRLNAITKDGSKQVAKVTWTTTVTDEKGEDVVKNKLAGIAAHDGVLVASLRNRGLLLFVNASDGQVLGEQKIADPRGVAFDREGRLLVLSGRELRRYALQGLPTAAALDAGTVVVRGLDDPSGLAIAPDGTLFVSDRGASHQVKMFAADGSARGVLGQPGEPAAGLYNALHMNNPAGVTVDDRGRVWVAECDELPKRVSVWKRDGKLDRAFYGPSEYGGGGRLDSRDPTKFFYHGMEFALDWKSGTSELRRVLFRPGKDELGLPDSGHAIRGYPEHAVYVNGRRYLTNCYSSNPTGGPSVAMLWIDDDEKKSVRPVAAIGEANDWPHLGTEPFHSRWPAGAKPPGDRGKNAASFIWTDTDGDGQLEPEEVTMQAGPSGGVTVMADASFVLTRLAGNGARLVPESWDARGVPKFDFAKAETLARDVHGPASSGGNAALTHSNGATLFMNGVAPFHSHSLSGTLKGEPRWSYPNLWPGLHASHEAPIPEERGQIVGTTRLLGGWVETRGAGPLAFINGNMGPIYVFTADGLFVTQLFEDSRVGRPWAMPRAIRGMSLKGVTTHDENFWPTVTQTADGQVFLVDGGRSSLVRVEGLEKLRRLPDSTITVSQADLAAAQAWQTEREAARQKARGGDTLLVALRAKAPVVDGKLDEWSSAEWAPIDQRGTKAHFNSDSKPYDVQGALAVAEGQLFAAYRTGDARLLGNSGEQPQALFKTGGALDLMIATDPAARRDRSAPTAGDLRLLVTVVKDQPRALLYRAVVSGTKPGDRVPFSSPSRTIYFDRVEDVTAQLRFAADKSGNYEFAIPLATLGLKPVAGQTLGGDLGILRGDGTRTTARVYWSNKATAITADVPSEAQLTPALWGKLRIQE